MRATLSPERIARGKLKRTLTRLQMIDVQVRREFLPLSRGGSQVTDPTVDEGGRAFHAPSHPYHRPHGERVVLLPGQQDEESNHKSYPSREMKNRDNDELADESRCFTTLPDGSYATYFGTEIDPNDPWMERKLKVTPFIDWRDGNIYLHVFLNRGRFEWWKVTGRAGYYIKGYDLYGSMRWNATRCEEPIRLTPIKATLPKPDLRSLDDEFDT